MELSLGEIRNFMLLNGGKVTNHTLVKHFKEFLTHPQTQNEARKQFKTIVNMLASIKTEEKADGTFEKYLILKPKYFNECPAEGDSLNQSMSMNFSVMPMSPSSTSLYSEYDGSSPSRQPPPYRAPPQVSSPNQPPPPPPLKLPQLEHDTGIKYRDCIDEYKTAVTAIRKQTGHEPLQKSLSMEAPPPAVPPRRRSSGSMDQVIPGQVGPVERPILESDNASMYDTLSRQSVTGEMVVQEMFDLAKSESESKLSVKEATKKFNQIASEEEKIATPSPKRITDRKVPEHQNHHHTNGDLGASHLDTENLISHPKAREWMVSAARANYQELSKLANEYPNLVRLQDPTNGYTALHWAAKHGNGDVVKLIAGTYKADVNARTNGGYTPLHLAMQFGRDEVFDLLQNVYKADRNLTDWSGKKPLDYSKQKTTVSASTYSSEYLEMLTYSRKNRHSTAFETHLFSTYPRRNHATESEMNLTGSRPHKNRHSTVDTVQRNFSLLLKPKNVEESDGGDFETSTNSSNSEMGTFNRHVKSNQSSLGKKFRSFNRRKRI